MTVAELVRWFGALQVWQAALLLGLAGLILPAGYWILALAREGAHQTARRRTSRKTPGSRADLENAIRTWRNGQA